MESRDRWVHVSPSPADFDPLLAHAPSQQHHLASTCQETDSIQLPFSSSSSSSPSPSPFPPPTIGLPSSPSSSIPAALHPLTRTAIDEEKDDEPVFAPTLSDPLSSLSTFDSNCSSAPFLSDGEIASPLSPASDVAAAIVSGASARRGSSSSSNSDSSEVAAVEAAASSVQSSWSSSKLRILSQFSTRGIITVSPSFDVLNTPQKPSKSWEGADEFETCIKLQQDMVKQLRQLNDDLAHAWLRGERMAALRLAVKAAKGLEDPQRGLPSFLFFYPSLFVLVTDVLDSLCALVWERLKMKAEEQRRGKSSRDGKQAQAQGTVQHSLHGSTSAARETAANWFLKVSQIPEPLLRLYLEVALLRCSHFCDEGGPFQRATRISDSLIELHRTYHPLTVAYARLHFVRSLCACWPTAATAGVAAASGTLVADGGRCLHGLLVRALKDHCKLHTVAANAPPAAVAVGAPGQGDGRRAGGAAGRGKPGSWWDWAGGSGSSSSSPMGNSSSSSSSSSNSSSSGGAESQGKRSRWGQFPLELLQPVVEYIVRRLLESSDEEGVSSLVTSGGLFSSAATLGAAAPAATLVLLQHLPPAALLRYASSIVAIIRSLPVGGGGGGGSGGSSGRSNSNADSSSNSSSSASNCAEIGTQAACLAVFLERLEAAVTSSRSLQTSSDEMANQLQHPLDECKQMALLCSPSVGDFLRMASPLLGLLLHSQKPHLSSPSQLSNQLVDSTVARLLSDVLIRLRGDQSPKQASTAEHSVRAINRHAAPATASRWHLSTTEAALLESFVERCLGHVAPSLVTSSLLQKGLLLEVVRGLPSATARAGVCRRALEIVARSGARLRLGAPSSRLLGVSALLHDSLVESAAAQTDCHHAARLVASALLPKVSHSEELENHLRFLEECRAAFHSPDFSPVLVSVVQQANALSARSLERRAIPTTGNSSVDKKQKKTNPHSTTTTPPLPSVSSQEFGRVCSTLCSLTLVSLPSTPSKAQVTVLSAQVALAHGLLAHSHAHVELALHVVDECLQGVAVQHHQQQQQRQLQPQQQQLLTILTDCLCLLAGFLVQLPAMQRDGPCRFFDTILDIIGHSARTSDSSPTSSPLHASQRLQVVCAVLRAVGALQQQRIDALSSVDAAGAAGAAGAASAVAGGGGGATMGPPLLLQRAMDEGSAEAIARWLSLFDPIVGEKLQSLRHAIVAKRIPSLLDEVEKNHPAEASRAFLDVCNTLCTLPQADAKLVKRCRALVAAAEDSLAAAHNPSSTKSYFMATVHAMDAAVPAT